MRPVRLQVHGFSAFREPAEITFEGTDLIAFVGPTGSGKSSLIDAITFALYGSVSRYDDLRLVEPVIHQLANEARVRLDFELSGQRYTAVRVVTRTKTGATTKEARLVRHGDDGAEQILAGQAREMPEAVRSLLGLDFEQFTRTVVLPQGDFAVFLHADKSTRQKLLRQLLDVGAYERMGKLARTHAAVAQTRLDLLIEQRDAKGEATPEQLADLETRIGVLGALQASVAERLGVVADLDSRIASAATALAALEQVAKALAKIVVPRAVTELAPHIAEAEAALTRATADRKTARSARDTAQTAMADGPDITAVQRSMGALADLARLTTEIDELAPTEVAASDAAAEAEAAAQSAGTAFEEADLAHRAARDTAGLGAVIAALVVGEPCPVCAQTVHDLPSHDVDAELAQAKAALATAKTANAQATKEATARERERVELATKLESLRADRERAEERVSPGTDQSTLQAQLVDAEALKLALNTAVAAVAEAETLEEQAQATLDRHRTAEAKLRGDLTLARDSVGTRTPPAPEGRSLQDDWSALATWAGAERDATTEELASARTTVDELKASQRQATAAIEAACTEAGVTGPIARMNELIATAVANAVHAHDAALARLQELADLAEETARLEETIALNREMGQLLSVSGFERWLVQSALDDLLARATDRLFELSAGQFSLESEDGEFSIRDHRNADEVRNVRTLSGGETFLASLALALALAESIADLATEGGPRLESMFLDEGFGTLDPDTLDIVATTMEELSASGRLIGIVTHIRDLADRMPVRFEVHKDATTARVERVEV
jgi:exonuclease SbcC